MNFLEYYRNLKGFDKDFIKTYNLYKNGIISENDISNYILNKNFGLGNDPSLNNYLYAVPYVGVNTPSKNSEYNDVSSIKVLNIMTLYQKHAHSFQRKQH